MYFTVSGFSPVDVMKASITLRPPEPLPLAISWFSDCSGLRRWRRSEREDGVGAF